MTTATSTAEPREATGPVADEDFLHAARAGVPERPFPCAVAGLDRDLHPAVSGIVVPPRGSGPDGTGSDNARHVERHVSGKLFA